MLPFLRMIADFAFPRTCMVCGRELLYSEQDLCLVCRADLPLTRYSAMERNPMADRFNAVLQKEIGQNGQFEPYAYASALFHYIPESGYSSITRNLKYKRGIASGRRFAALLGKELAASPLFRDVDTVIPVPLHPSRRRERGYNQAEVIAAEIARQLPLAKMESRLLERAKKTASQATLPTAVKAANVRGAFRVRERTLKKYAEGGGAFPHHILLVDDVFTTGSTLAACHSALRALFPPQVRISVATLGETGSD